jgi:hypothetical protein
MNADKRGFFLGNLLNQISEYNSGNLTRTHGTLKEQDPDKEC